MKKKILSLLMKLLVRDAKVFDVSDYPNYQGLRDFGYIMINTLFGSFMFLIKEDVQRKDYDSGKVLKNRYFTVELKSPPESIIEPKVDMSEKIVLVVKIGRFYFTKKSIMNFLANIYLEQIWSKEQSKLKIS